MKKVLVIEDNESNMELVSFILNANNFSVIKAYRGQEGIDMALTHIPDLILLDIQLPDMDGIKVLKVIRDREEIADIPVIAVTSYAMTGDSKKLLSAGCDGYIEKPIDIDAIVKQINKLLPTD